MRRQLRVIKENILKVVGFIALAYAVYWVHGKREPALRFLTPEQFRLIFIALVVLLVIYGLSLLESIIQSGWLKRFDPADPESLEGLSRMRRYRPSQAKRDALKKDKELLDTLHIYLRSRGFEEQIRRGFGLIYERQLLGVDRHLKPRWQRIFVLYRPILNVLIVDQMLKEAIDFVDRQEPHATMNQYVMVTDMHNEQEVLSAAAGVVNFLGSLDNAYLSPILIDQDGGRIFYPYDRSLLSFRQKAFHDFFIFDFLGFLTSRARRERSKEKQKSDTRIVAPRIEPERQQKKRSQLQRKAHKGGRNVAPPRPVGTQRRVRRPVSKPTPKPPQPPVSRPPVE